MACHDFTGSENHVCHTCDAHGCAVSHAVLSSIATSSNLTAADYLPNTEISVQEDR